MRNFFLFTVLLLVSCCAEAPKEQIATGEEIKPPEKHIYLIEEQEIGRDKVYYYKVDSFFFVRDRDQLIRVR